ncbi:MAG TPA: hypothetical protein VGM78_15740, partial [Ilumatobacteraceae bacterium]
MATRWRRWVADDHASAAGRFDSSITQHVPREHWRDGAGGSSIAFLLFHTTFHQDLAFNTAMTGRAPLLDAHRDVLGLASFAPGAGLAEAEDPSLTAALDLDQLVRYAADVNDAVSTGLDEMDVSAVDGVPPANERVAGIAGIPVD